MKYYFSLIILGFMILPWVGLLAAPPTGIFPSSAIQGYDGIRWVPVKVLPDGTIMVDAEVSIGSISVEVFPVYANQNGVPATATVDLANRAIVNVGSETIGLITTISAITSALSNVLKVDAEISTDSIGLISALADIKAACASETTLVDAINAIETEMVNSNDMASLSLDIANLNTHLIAIKNAMLAPVSQNKTQVISGTSVATDVVSLANRKSVNFVNHSSSVTCWLSMDSAVASAAVGVGIPLFPYGGWGVELDSAKVVGVLADGVASVTVYQDGY